MKLKSFEYLQITKKKKKILEVLTILSRIIYLKIKLKKKKKTLRHSFSFYINFFINYFEINLKASMFYYYYFLS